MCCEMRVFFALFLHALHRVHALQFLCVQCHGSVLWLMPYNMHATALHMVGGLQMSDSKGPSHKPSFQCVVKVQKPGPRNENMERYVGEGANKKVLCLHTHMKRSIERQIDRYIDRWIDPYTHVFVEVRNFFLLFFRLPFPNFPISRGRCGCMCVSVVGIQLW